MATPRILMLPVADERGASTRYRVLAHLPALREAGLEVTVRYPRELGLRGRRRLLTRGLDLLRGPYGPADLLFLQRRVFPAPLAWRLRRVAAPVVFDMDAAIDLPPPGVDAGEADRRRYRRNFEATVHAADLVLCGNRYLAGRLPHDRFAVLPTSIDTERFRPGALAKADRPALGWVGHSDNLPALEALAGPLREVARRHPGLRTIVVADHPPRIPGIALEFRRWSLADEVRAFEGITVGLMPLGDDPWTRGKCAFKGIQYMALGIPTVASPVGMNGELIRHGENGFLPRDAAGWVDVLDALLTDPARAREVGEAGRRTVERGYSLAAASARLVDILSGRLAGRRNAVARFP